MTINTRINDFIAYLGVTPYEFSKKMGNKRHDTIYNLLNNHETSPSPKTLNRIKETYPQINYTWLLTGEGSMLKDSNVGTQVENEDREDYKNKYINVLEQLLEAKEEINLLQEVREKTIATLKKREERQGYESGLQKE